jgi:hypothetical protein
VSPDDEKTPAHTPAAKKSSGAWRLNLDEVACARPGCAHRRDHHTTVGGGSHRWHCLECECPEFVAGGIDYDRLPDTLPASSNPPPKE